jgi:hypothetical protein
VTGPGFAGRANGRNGTTLIRGADDLILAGSQFRGSVTLTGNSSPDVTIPSGETRNYGIGVVGNRAVGRLSCKDNEPGVTDYGAPNLVIGDKVGQCEGV